MNKSLITNLIAIIVIILGYVLDCSLIKSAGLFALSGAITNWLAIHMLFEKIPFLYGSGIIPLHFADFKLSIKNLILTQFFTMDNIQKFFDANNTDAVHHNIADKITSSLDFEEIYNKLIEVILQSQFGSMLSMIGGEKSLEPLKQPFIAKIKVLINETAATDKFQHAISGAMLSDNIQKNIEDIVDKRLDELTPQMVKQIIQDMIRQHLGWLVVWGGVFGGILGIGAGVL